MPTLRDLVPDYCTPPEELTGMAEGLRGTPEAGERGVVSSMPGDESHPLTGEHNPFLYLPPRRIRLMLQSGLLSPEEEQQANNAMQLLQVQQSDATHEGGGYRPPHR